MKHMNKILALLLAVLMMISLAACGGGGGDTSTDTPDSSAPATGNEAAGNDATESEPAGGDTSSEVEAELPDENLTVHENTFFNVGYNEEDGWVIEEDDYYMSEYGGNVNLRILDADGYTDVMVEIGLTKRTHLTSARHCTQTVSI